jgi:hypothetical protein
VTIFSWNVSARKSAAAFPPASISVFAVCANT